MVGLVDCNNFFVSCERVFRPELLDRPVIVLSNNDGCAVALSNEAKALGFRRGDPYFKIKDVADRHGVVVFSGNHRLYGDMSSRVMATLHTLADSVEVYSIDEAFIEVPSDIRDYSSYGQNMVRRVRRNTGIPVSLGMAPTKTLAKMAARFAKKFPAYRGACMIDTAEKADKAMSLTQIEDVWGIGRRHARRLRAMGVNTALDMANMPREQVENIFSIVGVRTWLELRGTPAVSDDNHDTDKKTITSSRSFARDIYDRAQLEQAFTGFATIIGRKLRQQDSAACELSVFIATNRFNDRQPQYFNSATCELVNPTSDTTLIVEAALRTLNNIYRRGIGYKKAGLTITRLMPAAMVHPTLFDDRDALDKRQRLMHAVDVINSSPGNPNVVTLASMGGGFQDMIRREHASRLYTTRFSDIIEIHSSPKDKKTSRE